MSGSSSEGERMGLQIKPPPLIAPESSKSGKSQSHDRRRALASRLGPKDYSSSSGSQSQERSSSSKSHRRPNPGGGDDRRDRVRRDGSGGGYSTSQLYEERLHHMGSSGSNWDRGRGQRDFGRDYDRGQGQSEGQNRVRSRKRSIRERLGPADPDSRTGRYWEEKSTVSSASASAGSIKELLGSGSGSGGDSHREKLMKHKERRKNLEEEEERAFREIEKRRQRERREAERREPREKDKDRRGRDRDRDRGRERESRHASEEEEDEGVSPSKVAATATSDDGNDPDTQNQEVEEEEETEMVVEEIEVSSASGSSGGEGEVEEVEEGVLPSHSDVSGSEGEEESKSKSHSRNKRGVVHGRSRDSREPVPTGSAGASAQNSDISSEEEHEDDGSRQGSSSSKSSSDSDSDSSSEEDSRSSGEEEGERSVTPSPLAKRNHHRKKEGGEKSHSSSASSSKRRRADERENGGKRLSEKSESDGGESGREEDDNADRNSDVEMLEVKGKGGAGGSPKVPEIKLPEVELTEVEKKKLELNFLPPYYPAIQGCRRVEEFTLLNRIEEGTYGVVYRAKDKRTNEIVALKRLKMEKEKDGFPITSLREINTLLKAQHENIVTVREIVVGSNTDKIFLVMDYVEHDLKALMETLRQKEQTFILVEIKCLMIQLLKAVAHLHDNWILHRDLKASNILLSHKGILKVGDFGLAREYGSPLKPYTPIVVTLWYRAPELLLQTKEYSTPIDMWSVGCIFGELLKMDPMFPGKSEANQLNLIFSTLGTPNDKIWPGYSKLPLLQKLTFTDNPVNKLKSRFPTLSELGIDLLNKMLTYCPAKRISAEDALQHAFFRERPLAIDPSVFSTWPAKSEMGHRKAVASPKPPSGGRQFKDLKEDDGEAAGFFLGDRDKRPPMGAGFNLKF